MIFIFSFFYLISKVVKSDSFIKKKQSIRDEISQFKFLFSHFFPVFSCRYPGLSGKIGKLMNDYVMALRSKDDTPGLHLTMTREAEEAILDKFQADIAAKQQGMQFHN